MDQADLQNLQGDKVADIVGVLDDMTLEDVQALKALEEAAEKPRTGLLEKLDERIAELGQSGGESGADGQSDAEQKDGGKQARGEEAPAWQKEDYDGPLTGEQAMWRNANLTTK